MNDVLRYTKVAFKRFKAFESFTLNLRRMNVMVGPNNAGKSTILAAFRILAEGLRKANRRRPELVEAPEGPRYGYSVDFSACPWPTRTSFSLPRLHTRVGYVLAYGP